ncbi:serine hydrolase domain-containing protein [Maribellus mangrovi]|uniref:serine hydrolase domain-containing protein n=1 Tax=Maribellus mangrovi TaxID=3133146 RepID=UPI0030EDCFEE
MKLPSSNIKLGAIVFIAIVISSCRAIYYNIPDIDDHKIFPAQTIRHDDSNVFRFYKAENANDFGKEILVNNKSFGTQVVDLESFCNCTQTAAFLIIRNDSVIYEYYGEGYSDSTLLNPFSITKAFLTTLTGIAIREGKIKSVDDPVSKYLPEFSDTEIGDVKIRQLLKHTSGIKFNDSQLNPLAGNAKYYYGRNLRKYMTRLELDTPEGTEYKYSSANAQLLAMTIERAVDTTLSAYLESRLWQEIGMQYDGSWSMDRKGENAMEKAFSGLNSTPIDLAKLGRLYLQKGKWDNKAIIPKEFVCEATKRDVSEGSRLDYQYNFGVGPEKYGSFFAVGLYGQLVYVYPEEQIIMVRNAESCRHYNPPFIYYVMAQIVDQL